MELKIFFDPLNKDEFLLSEDTTNLHNTIKINFESFPNWKEAHIAIIGLTESRGNIANEGTERAANAIRKKLYHLKKGSGSYQIVDLGNLRCGVKLEDTYLRIKEVCEILLEYSTFPIFIGGTHDLDLGIFYAYEKFNKFITFLNIDSELDLQTEYINNASLSHIHKILTHQPNYLFHFANLAYQSYLNDPLLIDVIEKLYFENIRLGILRENIKEAEPIIRMADTMSFDIGAIKMTDAPGNPKVRSFGLTGEDACQICWYAGMSTKLTSAGFFEYNPDLDVREQTAQMISIMIWYLIEGYYNRKYEPDFLGDGYTRYIISYDQKTVPLIFYKSNFTEKWWMEVSLNQNNVQLPKKVIIPCSYQDYLTATSGELPNRWIQIYNKLF